MKRLVLCALTAALLLSAPAANAMRFADNPPDPQAVPSALVFALTLLIP